jgi:hypothetical protein
MRESSTTSTIIQISTNIQVNRSVFKPKLRDLGKNKERPILPLDAPSRARQPKMISPGAEGGRAAKQGFPKRFTLQSRGANRALKSRIKTNELMNRLDGIRFVTYTKLSIWEKVRARRKGMLLSMSGRMRWCIGPGERQGVSATLTVPDLDRRSHVRQKLSR